MINSMTVLSYNVKFYDGCVMVKEEWQSNICNMFTVTYRRSTEMCTEKVREEREGEGWSKGEIRPKQVGH